jgi:hypothetical protein
MNEKYPSAKKDVKLPFIDKNWDWQFSLKVG